MIKALKSTKERFRRQTKRTEIAQHATEENNTRNDNPRTDNNAGQQIEFNKLQENEEYINIQIDAPSSNNTELLQSTSLIHDELWDIDNSDVES